MWTSTSTHTELYDSEDAKLENEVTHGIIYDSEESKGIGFFVFFGGASELLLGGTAVLRAKPKKGFAKVRNP